MSYVFLLILKTVALDKRHILINIFVIAPGKLDVGTEWKC